MTSYTELIDNLKKYNVPSVRYLGDYYAPVFKMDNEFAPRILGFEFSIGDIIHNSSDDEYYIYMVDDNNIYKWELMEKENNDILKIVGDNSI